MTNPEDLLPGFNHISQDANRGNLQSPSDKHWLLYIISSNLIYRSFWGIKSKNKSSRFSSQGPSTNGLALIITLNLAETRGGGGKLIQLLSPWAEEAAGGGGVREVSATVLKA